MQIDLCMHVEAEALTSDLDIQFTYVKDVFFFTVTFYSKEKRTEKI